MGTLIEAFKEVQPGITVNYTGSGSGAGVTGAQEGSCDIGLASRDLKAEETGVEQITVAKDGIAIIVNPENPVSDLSLEQIAALATGATANWSEVGGNDAQVVFMGREAGSGTRGRLRVHHRHRGHLRVSERVHLHRRGGCRCGGQPQRHRLCLPVCRHRR